MKIKHGLLAAVASVGLIAGANGLYAQGGASGGAGGDTQMQGGGKAGAQMPGSTPGGAQVQGQGGAQGGAQVQGQGGAKTGAGAQTQTQGTGKAQNGQTGMDSKPGQAQTRDRDTNRDSAQGGKEAGDKPVQLSDQQRTKISSSIRDTKNLKRVDRTNINFNINVGTVVPRTIGLVPLPGPIVAVVPAYRGYLYIVVGDELLIVHPRTYEIVAVIPA